MTSNEIASMDSIDRLIAFRQDDIISAISYLKAYPKAPVAPVLRQIIKWLCDNPRGYCNLSVPRLAKLLGRVANAPFRKAFKSCSTPI